MRRKPVQREKHEQAAIVQLLRSIGASVYVLGTRRSAGKPCPKCGTFVQEHQGTRQTPGIPDLYAMLPRREALWIEVKAAGGRLSAAQEAFRDALAGANHHYVSGGLDDVIAWLVGSGYLKSTQVPHYRLGEEAS